MHEFVENAVAVIIWLAILVGSVSGWVLNVINVIHAVSMPLTGLFILQCFGIVFFPLGVILGWVC